MSRIWPSAWGSFPVIFSCVPRRPSGKLDDGRYEPKTLLVAVTVAYSSPTVFGFMSTLFAVATVAVPPPPMAVAQVVLGAHCTCIEFWKYAFVPIFLARSSTTKTTLCGTHQ